MPSGPLITPLPDRVRASCAAVTARATLVTVNHGSIAGYARSIDTAAAHRAAAADKVGDTSTNRSDPERAIGISLSNAAVNFTSGWHDIMRKQPGMSGAVSIVNRLNHYESATGPWDAARLQRLTVADCSQIFGQECDGGAIEQLLSLLADALNDLGRLVEDHGSFVDVVGSANHSAIALAELLAVRPPWRDVAEHAGELVEFHKRAQMAAAGLSRTFGGVGPGRFDDLDELTIFADNLVPHVLRIDGLLEYDPSLLRAIEMAELLPHGSVGEVEIRAAAVHVADLIVRELQATGTDIDATVLDHHLWSRGAGAEYKAQRRHRCRNRFY